MSEAWYTVEGTCIWWILQNDKLFVWGLIIIILLLFFGNRIAELVERENGVYHKLDPDPFDDRHPGNSCSLTLLSSQSDTERFYGVKRQTILLPVPVAVKTNTNIWFYRDSISVLWSIYIINSVDKTNFFYTTCPPTQHHSFFRNYPLHSFVAVNNPAIFFF